MKKIFSLIAVTLLLLADYSYYSAQMQYHGGRAYDLLQKFHRKYHF